VLEEVDPRDLRATQPSVTREGVSYYLTPRYKRTGQTFADYHRVVNRFPVIYQREDGEQLIISGHHRAAVALLEGKQFESPRRVRRLDVYRNYATPLAPNPL